MGLDIVDAGAPGIKRLADVSLQASVERVLASLPDSDKAATVDIGFDSQGIRAVAAVKLEHGWSIQGVLDKRYHGSWTGEAHLRWSGR